MVRVKICGLTRQADAEATIRFGADFLGFNFEPSSPRFIGHVGPTWMQDLPAALAKVAVFGPYRGSIDVSAYDMVQAAEWGGGVLPRRRIHVLRLRAGDTVDGALSNLKPQTSNFEMLLLDAWREDAYGGTGRRVDWSLAAELVQYLEVPVILAGGLTPDNVAIAVHQVRPYAVDVSSGVEASPGIKDLGKVKAFIDAARGA